jgi:hypothetical protein
MLNKIQFILIFFFVSNPISAKASKLNSVEIYNQIQTKLLGSVLYMRHTLMMKTHA